jgi:hypothetical protein
MTSLRQIEANRCNATKSTGPKTAAGKMRSRRNAVRHGLSAETVIEIVEDIEDYQGFEAAVIADYDARTAVERELVLRLASLFWRLRRATAIETDLFRIQAEILHDRRQAQLADWAIEGSYPVLEVTELCSSQSDEHGGGPWQTPRSCCNSPPEEPEVFKPVRQLAVCFQRIANFDNGVFDRLGRYESALVRQVVQTLFLLQTARGSRNSGRASTRRCQYERDSY